MRYRQILEESPKAYLQMYAGIPILDQWDVLNFVDKCEKKLKKKDRVIWMVRWHRVWYANHVNELLDHKHRNAEKDDEGNNVDPSIPQPVGDKVWRRLLQGVGYNDWSQAVDEADETLAAFETYKHYCDMQVAAVSNIVWDRQTPDDLLAELRAAEDAWKESLSENRAVKLRGDEEIALDFKNGWAWWDLNRASCRDEANAMGHCGNGDSYGRETILSLRKHVEGPYWSPHLTFINHDGVLGEMKGRNNDKPTSKYHDMIVALLKSDNVTEIKGGGYLPENNFALADLTVEEQKELKELKPGLRELHDVYPEWKEMKEQGPFDEKLNQVFENKLEFALEKVGSNGYDSIDYEKQEIIIDSTGRMSYLTHNSGLVGKLSELLEDMGLEELIEKYAENDNDVRDAAKIEEIVKDLCFEPLLEMFLGQDYSFRLSGVHKRQTEDRQKIETVISFHDFVYEDDETLEHLKSLDDTDDHDDPDFDWLERPQDKAAAAVFDFVIDVTKMQNSNRSAWRPQDKQTNLSNEERALVETILKLYGSEEDDNSGRRKYTPTIPDERQGEFDFGDAKDQKQRRAA